MILPFSELSRSYDLLPFRLSFCFEKIDVNGFQLVGLTAGVTILNANNAALLRMLSKYALEKKQKCFLYFLLMISKAERLGTN